MESNSEMDVALKYYEAANDILSLVRVYCFCGNIEKVTPCLSVKCNVLTGVENSVMGGGGGGEAHTHTSMFCTINFVLNQWYVNTNIDSPNYLVCKFLDKVAGICKSVAVSYWLPNLSFPFLGCRDLQRNWRQSSKLPSC